MCPSNYNRFSDRARYWSKTVIFYSPRLAFDAPVGGWGGSRRNSATPFGVEELEWLGTWLPDGEKNIIRFGATHECDRQTDRQTPHAGNSHTMHSIARQKRCPIAYDRLHEN